MGIRDDDDEPIVIESAARRLANHSAGGMTAIRLPEGLQLWRPKKVGSHTIDIIPFKMGDAARKFSPSITFASVGSWTYERTFYTHAGVGVNNSSYVCLAKTLEKACPICEAMNKYRDSPAKEDVDRVKELKPKQRQLFLIYDHDATDKGVQLWEISNWNFGKHLDEYINGARKQDLASYQAFFDPKNGYTMRITGSEEQGGRGKPYSVYKPHQFYTRDRELPRSVVRHGFDLNTIPVILDYKTLRNVYEGITEDDEVLPPTNAVAPSRDESRGRRNDRGDEDDRDARRSRTDRDDRDADRDDPPRSRRDADRDDRDGDREEAPRARRHTAEDRDEPPRARRDDDRDAPEGDEPIEFATGDIVEYTYRGQKESGPIVSIDRERRVAAIKVDSQDRPRRMGIEELKLVERDDTFDRKPDPPAAKKPAVARGEDKAEEKPEPKPRTRGRKPDEEKAEEKSREKSRDDDREEKPRGRKNWDDDGDDDRTTGTPARRR